MRKLLFLSLLLLLSGCAMIREQVPFLPKPQARVGGVYKENLDADRLVDLVLVKKQTGKRSAGVFTNYAYYLEGYIRGVVVDYEDNPVEGAVVRVTDKGKDLPDSTWYFRRERYLPHQIFAAGSERQSGPARVHSVQSAVAAAADLLGARSNRRPRKASSVCILTKVPVSSVSAKTCRKPSPAKSLPA